MALTRGGADVACLCPQSEERLPLKFSKLVETVSKKPIPPHVKHLIVEVMVMDEEGEDVEVSSRIICVPLVPCSRSSSRFRSSSCTSEHVRATVGRRVYKCNGI